MEINELITFVTNNGIAVVLMIYFLKNNYKATNELITINKDLITEVKDLRKEQNTMYEIVRECKKAI